MTQASPPPDAVLLDDDALVRLTWSLAAKRAGRVLVTYAEPGALIMEAGRIPKDTPIYIDAHLGGGVNGEAAAAELARLGFSELHLETGDSPGSFPALPHIKSVRGKEPPWGSGP